jgi:oligoxyloglucan reducing-end-specific cellobiohydrolase
VDTVYLSRDGGNTWANLGLLASATGVDGPPYGNYYFGPSVYSPTPYLTFGDTSYPTSPFPSSKFGWWISALLIDPTNPNHLMYGTGATLYSTNNLSQADSGNASTWNVQVAGIEETAAIALISPTNCSSCPRLLSGVGDIGGFRHDDFTISPAGGMFTNPVATTVGSLDYAGQNGLAVARTQSPATATTSPCTYGAYATDGGANWTPFPKCATGGNSSNGGFIAIDASGTMFMWSPASGSSNRPQYSTNNGATWTATTGLPSRVQAVADKVTPNLFYAFYSSTGSTGGFYSTGTSNGATFTRLSAAPATTGTCSGTGCGIPYVNFANSNQIWLPLGTNGLYHSSNGGVTWTKIANVSVCNSMGIGSPAPAAGSPQSIFIYGTASPLGISALYRSDNNGASWLQINDTLHQYGGATLITADPQIYGRVYFGMNGRGIIYGDIAH